MKSSVCKHFYKGGQPREYGSHSGLPRPLGCLVQSESCPVFRIFGHFLPVCPASVNLNKDLRQIFSFNCFDSFRFPIAQCNPHRFVSTPWAWMVDHRDRNMQYPAVYLVVRNRIWFSECMASEAIIRLSQKHIFSSLHSVASEAIGLFVLSPFQLSGYPLNSNRWISV